MPPCEGDNNCYHDCEEAEADGGNILQTDKWGSEEQHVLTAQMQVHREGMLVKYKCQHVAF